MTSNARVKKNKPKKETHMIGESSSSKQDSLEPEEYEVEKIVAHQVQDDGTVLFKVRWRGYTEVDDSWEPEDNLCNANKAINVYRNEETVNNVKKTTPSKTRRERTRPPSLNISPTTRKPMKKNRNSAVNPRLSLPTFKETSKDKNENKHTSPKKDLETGYSTYENPLLVKLQAALLRSKITDAMIKTIMPILKSVLFEPMHTQVLLPNQALNRFGTEGASSFQDSVNIPSTRRENSERCEKPNGSGLQHDEETICIIPDSSSDKASLESKIIRGLTMDDGELKVVVGSGNNEMLLSVRDAYEVNSWGLVEYLLQHARFEA